MCQKHLPILHYVKHCYIVLLQWNAVYPGTFYPAIRLSVLLRNDKGQYKGDIAF